MKALDQISFHFKPGDRVGLVGNNGSGKTTLLRTIAGIYEPTGGTLSVLGNVASMLAIGLGMDAEVERLRKHYDPRPGYGHVKE